MKKKGKNKVSAAHVCLSCGKKVKEQKITREGFEIRIYKCKKCGFMFTHPGDTELLLLGKTGIKARVGKVGRQTIIRIPAQIRDLFKLGEKKSVFIKPVGKNKFLIET